MSLAFLTKPYPSRKTVRPNAPHQHATRGISELVLVLKKESEINSTTEKKNLRTSRSRESNRPASHLEKKKRYLQTFVLEYKSIKLRQRAEHACGWSNWKWTKRRERVLGARGAYCLLPHLQRKALVLCSCVGANHWRQAAKIRSESLGPVPGTRCPGNVLIHLSALYFFLEKESN